MADFNPYQAPGAHVEDINDSEEYELAGRGTRLGAVIIDSLIIMVPLLLAIVPVMMAFGAAGAGVGGADAMGVGAMIAIAIGSIGFLALFVVNLVMLHRTGQTIGKRLLNVKIVRTDGSRAGLTRIFFLRMVVPGMIGGLPFVGYIFSIVDPLFIFQESRRCVHDLIADTIVVLA